MKVLGISGSLRKRSFNTALLRATQELAPEDMEIEIFDLASIPIYNDDVRLEGYPPEVSKFRDAIGAADGIIIASPEYNRSVPGVLKNAIDWASRPPDQPFAGKPVTFMGVSNGALGAAFANYHLRQIFVYLDARMLNGREVMIGDAKNKFDASLNLVHEPTRQFISEHLRKLGALIRMTHITSSERN